MLAPESRVDRSNLSRDGGLRAQAVLDTLSVTDTVYHQLAFTRPLVDTLIRAVRRGVPAGRVLVIGPNELLARVLVDLGYELELWMPDGFPLSPEMQRLVSRSGPLNDLLRATPEHAPDLIVLPYVIEAAGMEPSELLPMLGRHLKPGGALVLACRQPGELRGRLLDRTWKEDATRPPRRVYPLSPTWPAPPVRRLITKSELARVGAGKFKVQAAELTIGHRAYLTTEPMSIWQWLVRVGLHITKVAIPSFRDCVVVTLVPSRSGKAG